MSFAEEFLYDPSCFPTDSRAPGWGAEQVWLDFLGGPYRFTGLSAAQIKAVEKRFDGLLGLENQDSATIHTQILKAPASWFRTIDTRGWENHMDFDYGENSIRIAGMNFLARIDLAPNLTAWLWTPEDAGLVELGAFENLFRVLLAYRLLADGGVLLHSAALNDGNNAWLFLGRSGAGKSTISRLGTEAGLGLLSDDMNAVFAQEGQYLCEQLPFAGTYGQTSWSRGRFPVAGIHILNKNTENKLEQLSTAKRLAMLAVCSPFVNADPFRQQRLLDNLGQMARSIGGNKLSFSLQGGFHKLLQLSSEQGGVA